MPSMPPLLRSEPLVESLVNRFMKKRKRAAYEISKESFQGDDTEIVKLYDEEGTVLGQVAFVKTKGGEIDLQVITVNDWSEEAATVERLLKFMDRTAKIKKIKVLRAELYLSDAKTIDKIEQMKAYGWRTQDVGRMGQRASHTLVRKLG
ncbi:MAG TPA: hypothetical protein VJ547_02400 [Candidatus Thermoplasmatota archaeon]|nr:hypothetical protein [Candidatus Thermoplasmatota archaeon]